MSGRSFGAACRPCWASAHPFVPISPRVQRSCRIRSREPPPLLSSSRRRTLGAPTHRSRRRTSAPRRRERRWMTSRRAMTAPHGRVRPDIAVVAAGTRDHPRAGSGAADTPARVPSCRHRPRTLGHRTHSTRHFQVDGAGPPSGWASGPPGGPLGKRFLVACNRIRVGRAADAGCHGSSCPWRAVQGRPRTHVGPPAGAAERPETSANAVRFCVDVIAPVSKRPIWLVDAARSSIARPPTTQGIAGSRPSRSASFTSS